MAVATLVAFPFVPAFASGTEAPVETKVEAAMEAPVETAVEAPLETIVEAPVETIVEAPAETIVESPVETKTAGGAGQGTSLKISKDVDSVTAPGTKITLEKTA